MADGLRRVHKAFAQFRLLPDMQQVQELVAHPRNVFFEHGPAVVEILPVPGLHPLLEDKEAPFERRREVFDGVGHAGHGFTHDGDPVGFQQFPRARGDELLHMFGVAADLFAQGVLFGGTFQRVLQQVVVDGLGNEVRRAEAQAFDGVVHVAVPGDHDDLRVGILIAHPFQQGQAVHARHTDVGDHDGEGIGGERLQRFAGALGGVDVIAEIPDQGPEDMADAGFIINEQNANGSVHAVSLLQEICSGCGPETPPALFPSAGAFGARSPRRVMGSRISKRAPPSSRFRAEMEPPKSLTSP